jgi:hypothetical protein
MDQQEHVERIVRVIPTILRMEQIFVQ